MESSPLITSLSLPFILVDKYTNHFMLKYLDILEIVEATSLLDVNLSNTVYIVQTWVPCWLLLGTNSSFISVIMYFTPDHRGSMWKLGLASDVQALWLGLAFITFVISMLLVNTNHLFQGLHSNGTLLFNALCYGWVCLLCGTRVLVVWRWALLFPIT